ncbi:MAG: hypothetical protein ACHQ50_03110 [Fimbriimonadales bacterium]
MPDAADTRPQDPPPGSCGCVQFGIVPFVILFGAIGFQVGFKLGFWQAIFGAVIGVLASGPVYAVVIGIMRGLVRLILWLQRFRDEDQR